MTTPTLQERVNDALTRTYLSSYDQSYYCVAEVGAASKPDFSYQVLIAWDEGHGEYKASCNCADWRRQLHFCKHVLSTFVKWAEVRGL